jgi:hypothetical protein
LRETFEGVEGFGMFFQRHHALNHTRAIAKNGEKEFARFALVVEPASDCDGASDMFAGVFDGDDASSRLLILSHLPAHELFLMAKV